MRAPWRESRRRRVAWFGLILAVLLAHAVFALRVVSSVIGWNTAPLPRRIEITFDKPLQPAAPVAPVIAPAAPAPSPEPRPPRAIRSARASSAPRPASVPEDATAFRPPSPGEPSVSRAQLVGEAMALADKLERAQLAAEAASAASAAQERAVQIAAMKAEAAVSAASEALAGPARPQLDWPPSTRLSYTLSGVFRGGPIYGKSLVEWRRSGTHYQVQFDVHLSPFFDRHVYSDGQITPQGLSPTHYDESLELPLMAPRVSRIDFTDDEVVLSNGRRLIKFPQTQDQASQFVQFVWMFTTHPDLTRPGTLVDLPLALTSGVRRWKYRVEGIEPVQLPFGTIDAVHLVPVMDGPRRPNEYPFEFWTAPTLQYLPIRVLVPLDEKNYADLTLDALPLQATPVPDGGAASQAR